MGPAGRRILFHLSSGMLAASAGLSAFWLTGGDASSLWIVLTFVAAQAASAELFRAPGIELQRAGFQDVVSVGFASLSGGVLALLASAGSGGARTVVAAEALHFCGVILIFGALRLRRERSASVHPCRALLVDAGRPSETLLQELRLCLEPRYEPIGWLADDPLRRYRFFQGLPVLGAIEELPYLVEWHQVRAVLAVVSETEPTVRRRLTEAAQTAAIELVLLPSLHERLADARSKRIETETRAA